MPLCFYLFVIVVKVDVKARVVTVTGPRGTLTKDFKHVNIEILPTANTVCLQVWFGVRKHKACIGTVATHIENMIKGVTKVRYYKCLYACICMCAYIYMHLLMYVLVCLLRCTHRDTNTR